MFHFPACTVRCQISDKIIELLSETENLEEFLLASLNILINDENASHFKENSLIPKMTLEQFISKLKRLDAEIVNSDDAANNESFLYVAHLLKFFNDYFD